MKLTKPQQRALDVLAGCPDGSTEFALAQIGISRVVLDKLVDAGLAYTRIDKYSKPRDFEVTRYFIVITEGAKLPWTRKRA
jgi:hypothetical protein